jgi:hypothetical protein
VRRWAVLDPCLSRRDLGPSRRLEKSMRLSPLKRKFPRAPIHATATCTLGVGKQHLPATVWQIGEGGMFLELPVAASAEGAVAIAFELPGVGGQRVVAEPMYSLDKATRFAPYAVNGGVGFKFKDVAPATKAQIAHYVAKQKRTYEALQFALALRPPAPILPSLLRETGLTVIRDERELKEYVAQVIAQFRAAN